MAMATTNDNLKDLLEAGFHSVNQRIDGEVIPRLNTTNGRVNMHDEQIMKLMSLLPVALSWQNIGEKVLITFAGAVIGAVFTIMSGCQPRSGVFPTLPNPVEAITMQPQATATLTVDTLTDTPEPTATVTPTMAVPTQVDTPQDTAMPANTATATPTRVPPLEVTQIGGLPDNPCDNAPGALSVKGYSYILEEVPVQNVRAGPGVGYALVGSLVASEGPVHVYWAVAIQGNEWYSLDISCTRWAFDYGSLQDLG